MHVFTALAIMLSVSTTAASVRTTTTTTTTSTTSTTSMTTTLPDFFRGRRRFTTTTTTSLRNVRVSDATSITTKPPRVTFEFAWIRKIGIDCIGGLDSRLSIGETFTPEGHRRSYDAWPVHRCKKKCAADKRCFGFNYNTIFRICRYKKRFFREHQADNRSNDCYVYVRGLKALSQITTKTLKKVKFPFPWTRKKGVDCVGMKGMFGLLSIGEGVNDDGKRQAYDKWSVKQCKKKCAGHSECGGFNYMKGREECRYKRNIVADRNADAPTHDCYIYERGKKKRVRSGTTVRIVTSSSRVTFPSPWTLKKGVDCVGVGMHTVLYIGEGFIDGYRQSFDKWTIRKCKEKCAKHKHCGGFNYDHDHDMCRYKKRVSQDFVKAPTHDCYIYERGIKRHKNIAVAVSSRVTTAARAHKPVTTASVTTAARAHKPVTTAARAHKPVTTAARAHKPVTTAAVTTAARAHKPVTTAARAHKATASSRVTTRVATKSTTVSFPYAWFKVPHYNCVGAHLHGERLTVEQCKINCAKNSQCGGFNYVLHNGQYKCQYKKQLYSDKVRSAPKNDCYVYVRDTDATSRDAKSPKTTTGISLEDSGLQRRDATNLRKTTKDLVSRRPTTQAVSGRSDGSSRDRDTTAPRDARGLQTTNRYGLRGPDLSSRDNVRFTRRATKDDGRRRPTTAVSGRSDGSSRDRDTTASRDARGLQTTNRYGLRGPDLSSRDNVRFTRRATKDDGRRRPTTALSGRSDGSSRDRDTTASRDARGPKTTNRPTNDVYTRNSDRRSGNQKTTNETPRPTKAPETTSTPATTQADTTVTTTYYVTKTTTSTPATQSTTQTSRVDTTTATTYYESPEDMEKILAATESVSTATFIAIDHAKERRIQAEQQKVTSVGTIAGAVVVSVLALVGATVGIVVFVIRKIKKQEEYVNVSDMRDARINSVSL